MYNPSPKTSTGVFASVISPALSAGAVTGISGFLVGGAVGILRSAHPGVAAGLTGAQFFVLGSSFVYSREVLQVLAFSRRSNRSDLICSTTAGAVSGAAAGAFYGRVNSLTGAVLVGTIGHLGQRYVHAKAESKAVEADSRPLLDRLADSKWVPFRSISNSEYETMLNEKLLKIEAEVSIIDDKLAVLRNEKTHMAGKLSNS